ncbi:MAG TPA: peptidase M16, partial [Ectothiorhodospiraceae bacterium]|nr:peptidase M16 [Ectothiorhodospiraceae bacterium]
EISGDGFPYGLQLMVNALGTVLHGADALAALDIDPILAKLRQQIEDPEFIKGLAREILDNPHRVRMVMTPDTNLSVERETREAERLAEIKAKMNDVEKQQVIEQAAALQQRQEQQDDPEQLPKVGLEDIPAELAIVEGESSTIGKMPASWYARGTNGIVYQQVVVDLPELDDELAQLLPLFTDILTEVGSGGRDYLESQTLQAAVTGGIGASVSLRGAVDDVQRCRGSFTLSGKALVRNQAALADLMQETFESARFDELPRIRELVSQERMYREQRVTSAGHSLAMVAASAGLSPSAAQQHNWNGLSSIKHLKALDDSLDDKHVLESFAAKLEQLRSTLLNAPRQLLLIGEAEQREDISSHLQQRWQGHTADATTGLYLPVTASGQLQQGWATSTQVNFCARAYPGVCVEHNDAPALMILGGFLRNNYLHRTIREQGGAYGGGASYDTDSGTFRFYSYRDPRLQETLNDFDNSIKWLLDNNHEWRLVEEAILGVISSIDKPGSPAGEAKKSFYASLHGRTPEQRRRFRARILEVKEADLKRVAETYLKPELASTAVISDLSTLETQQGLEIIKL